MKQQHLTQQAVFGMSQQFSLPNLHLRVMKQQALIMKAVLG
jgi:hypothetical protein